MLCRAVPPGRSTAASPQTASSLAPASSSTAQGHHYILTKKQQPTETRLPQDAADQATSILNGNGGNSVEKKAENAAKQLRSGTIHHLRHRRRHQPRDRKRIHSRKKHHRRTAVGSSCGGRHVDVERVAAIMQAFYCWDDETARLTNQLRAHLPLMTSSSSELLRCRLLRRYDQCRQYFVDKVFRTGHGL